jgi:hypothetical protein
MYPKIQRWIKGQYGRTVKTCWIAHVMADNGLTKRIAFNRVDPNKRKTPCPDSKRAMISAALRHFKMIPN